MTETLETRAITHSKLLTLLEKNDFKIENGMEVELEKEAGGIFLIKTPKTHLSASPQNRLGESYLGTFTVKGKLDDDRKVDSINMVTGPYYDLIYLQESIRLTTLLKDEKIPFTDKRNKEVIREQAREYAEKLLRAAEEL